MFEKKILDLTWDHIDRYYLTLIQTFQYSLSTESSLAVWNQKIFDFLLYMDNWTLYIIKL